MAFVVLNPAVIVYFNNHCACRTAVLMAVINRSLASLTTNIINYFLEKMNLEHRKKKLCYRENSASRKIYVCIKGENTFTSGISRQLLSPAWQRSWAFSQQLKRCGVRTSCSYFMCPAFNSRWGQNFILSEVKTKTFLSLHCVATALESGIYSSVSKKSSLQTPVMLMQ